jgi:methionyl-tRNA formyltransferase
MKVIFMGTPDFAVPVIDAIDRAGHDIILVVTQPDRPKGRKKELVPSPVKEWALSHGKTIFQPEKIKRPEAVEELKKYQADVAVVAAYGQILSKEILELPRLGCINVHASLLPKYRGAAPIQWSILNGDKITGITTMQMGVGLDDGDILLQKEVSILPDETGGMLFDKLSLIGGELITETLDEAEKGELHPVKQDENLATHVGMIKKEYGNIDFSWGAEKIVNHIRGLNPWPSAYTIYNGNMLKIWKGVAISTADAGIEIDKTAVTGTISKVTRDELLVKTGSGYLSVKELQAAGKKKMEISEFLRGHDVKVGEVFSRE